MRKTAFSPFTILTLSLLACSGDPPAPAAEPPAQPEDDCAGLCQRLDTCSSAVDEADCVENCSEDRARNPEYLRLARRCAEESSCDEFEAGGEFADCVSDGTRDIELTDAGRELCAEAADRSSCNELDADEVQGSCEDTVARYYADDFLEALERCFEGEECADIADCVDEAGDDFDVFEGAAQAFAELFTPTASASTPEPESEPDPEANAGAGGAAADPAGGSGGSAGAQSPAPTCSHKPWNSTTVDSFEYTIPEIGGARYSFLFGEDSVPAAPSLLESEQGVGDYGLHSKVVDHAGEGGGLIVDFGDCIDASSFAGLSIRINSNLPVVLDVATFDTNPVEDEGGCMHACEHSYRGLEATPEWGQFKLPWSELTPGSSAMDPSQIIGIILYAIEPDGTIPSDWDVWIDDVEFY